MHSKVETTLRLGGQFPRNIKAHSFSLAVPSPNLLKPPQTFHHHQHAFHTRAQPRCLRWPCRGSDHSSERLPIPNRPKQRVFVRQAYVPTLPHSQSTSDFLTEYWCDQNEAQCPLICLQQPGVTSSTTQDNECDPVSLTSTLQRPRRCGDGGIWHLTAIGCPFLAPLNNGLNTWPEPELTTPQDQLTYSCVCDNGVSPNITQYSQTLPFFICQEWGNQCVTACNGDNTCQNSCRADHPCGAQSPFLGNYTSSSISHSASATGSGAAASSKVPVTGFGGAAETSASGGGSTGAAAATFVPGAATSMAVLFGSVFLGFAVLL